MILQSVISLILIGLLVMKGYVVGKSACLACLTYWLPYLLSYKATFRYSGANAAKKIVRSFYRGEAIKLTMSMVLFASVFIFFSPVPWVFFGVYLSMHFSAWLVPMIVK